MARIDITRIKNMTKSSSQLVGLIVFLVAGGLFALSKNETPAVAPAPGPEVEAAILGVPDGYERRLIDGVPVLEKNQPEKLFAVMIENSAEAWPLSGLSQARLVIEAPVEGNIPRFIAFFDETQEVSKIGPVRSARPYYVSWASGFNPMYAHVGGSPEALAKLRTISLPDLNEFFWGQFFWRGAGRYAPHNVYTSTDLLEEAFDTREFTQDDIPTWEYNEIIEAEGKEINSVMIPFSTGSNLYKAEWKYLEEENSFSRYQAKKQQSDLNNIDVLAKNIIIMYTTVSTIDNEGRKRLETLGTGKALLVRDGKVFDIEWRKPNNEEPLEFYFDDDNKAVLYPGKTWIEVVPLSTDIIIDYIEAE